MAAEGITHVAIESTSEYWKPLDNTIEGDFTVFLVNAAHVQQVPPGRRHLAIHEGHLVLVTDRDRPAVREGAPLLTSLSFTGTAAELRDRLDGLAAAGVTELAYQPAGPDIAGELERMRAAVG